MTVPKFVQSATKKIADVLQDMVPQWRHELTPSEQRIGVYLRGNDDLLTGLREIIEERTGRRAALPVPSDPLMCKAVMERDKELRWFLSRLEFIHSSPVAQSVEEDDREQPA